MGAHDGPRRPPAPPCPGRSRDLGRSHGGLEACHAVFIGDRFLKRVDNMLAREPTSGRITPRPATWRRARMRPRHIA